MADILRRAATCAVLGNIRVLTAADWLEYTISELNRIGCDREEYAGSEGYSEPAIR